MGSLREDEQAVARGRVTDANGYTAAITESSPTWRGLRLRTLARPIDFWCSDCEQDHHAREVVTYDDAEQVDLLLCMGCYATLRRLLTYRG
jgi:hypothetical protein